MKVNAVDYAILACVVGGACLKVDDDVCSRSDQIDTSHRNYLSVPIQLDRSRARYRLNTMIGQPGQPVSLMIDTGSTDIWIPSLKTDVCRVVNCQKRRGFNSSKSSTFQLLGNDVFNATYLWGNSHRGDYISETFGIGGLTIPNLTMGLVERGSPFDGGIMGLGFSNSEPGIFRHQYPKYPTFLELMKHHKYIKRMAYSVHLNNARSHTGTILFGGVNIAKMRNAAHLFPMLPNRAKQYRGLQVQFAGLSLRGSEGSVEFTSPSHRPIGALLDTGTICTSLPTSLIQAVEVYLNASGTRHIPDHPYKKVSCKLRERNLNVTVQLGSAKGPFLTLPLSDMIIPFRPTQVGAGVQECILLLGDSGSQESLLLGDDFLRTAYTVFDLENRAIAIANVSHGSAHEKIIALDNSSYMPFSNMQTWTAALQDDYKDLNGPPDTSHQASVVSRKQQTGYYIPTLVPASSSPSKPQLQEKLYAVMIDFEIGSKSGSNPQDYIQPYINGAYTPSKSTQTYSLYNPKDNSLVVDNIPICNAEDVDLAVKHAEEAYRNGPWSKFTAIQRTECFVRLAQLIEENLTDILTLDSLTSGNPVSLIPIREKLYVKNCVAYYTGWTDKFKGDYYPADDGYIKLIRHEPLGVCAAITAFNAPFATMILKVCPCLVTGNVIIVKPSEKTPLGSLALAPLFEQAGIPKGVVQVLVGDGSTGALLASHMRIRKLSFTGSIATGKKVQALAAQSNLKRVTLELGGKSPAVIFEDANLENALNWTINAILARSGQVCVAATRLYVQKSIAQKFIDMYTTKMSEAVDGMGDPQDPATKLGPLVDQKQFEKVKGMIDRGKTEAELVVGGKATGTLQSDDGNTEKEPRRSGCYIEPTVFLNPKPDAEIYRKEIFGPVSIIKTFETEEEVLTLANDSEYGLMAGVFTKDLNRAMRFAERLESGVVGVNCVTMLNVQAPFGGIKQSGTGRELGEYALREYTEPKSILINMNA